MLQSIEWRSFYFSDDDRKIIVDILSEKAADALQEHVAWSLSIQGYDGPTPHEIGDHARTFIRAVHELRKGVHVLGDDLSARNEIIRQFPSVPYPIDDDDGDTPESERPQHSTGVDWLDDLERVLNTAACFLREGGVETPEDEKRSRGRPIDIWGRELALCVGRLFQKNGKQPTASNSDNHFPTEFTRIMAFGLEGLGEVSHEAAMQRARNLTVWLMARQ